MNQAQLETLLAIVDQGTFEDAAFALGITPSAVSQRIKALEKVAGRVLLRRTNPVTATEAGEVLVQAARRMALLQAETMASLHSRLADVPLSVVVNADSLATWFSKVLKDVASWGNTSLSLRVEDESHSLNLLRRGDVLGAVSTESTPVAGCDCIAIGVMRYISVASPWLLDQYTIDGEVDWAQMPSLRFGPRDALQDNDLKGRISQVPKGRRVSQIPSAEAFVTATRVGLGWSLLPIEHATQHLESGEIVRLDNSVIEVPLFWHRWRLESPALQRLTDSVVASSASLRF